MPHARLSSAEISERGKSLYAQTIRPQVDTVDNLGKLVSINVETGDCELGDDSTLDAPRRLLARHPDAAIYTLRVDYDAVYALGGAYALQIP